MSVEVLSVFVDVALMQVYVSILCAAKKRTTRTAKGEEEHVSLGESGSESEADMTSDEESD